MQASAVGTTGPFQSNGCATHGTRSYAAWRYVLAGQGLVPHPVPLLQEDGSLQERLPCAQGERSTFEGLVGPNYVLDVTRFPHRFLASVSCIAYFGTLICLQQLVATGSRLSIVDAFGDEHQCITTWLGKTHIEGCDATVLCDKHRFLLNGTWRHSP